ncbi:SCO family protein [soil metagenome]
MRYLSIFLLAILLFTACQKTQTQNQNTSTEAKRYKIKGKVVSVDKAAKKAEIEHEEIVGYMAAMTMKFPIKDDWVWDDLAVGSEIQADLVVDKGDYWLENLGISALPNPNQTPLPVNDKFAQIGKQIVDFNLTNQDGKTISSKDFRGRAWAITFIYAQCPLPDYCIKMSTNFSDAANQIVNSEYKDKLALLSISFDPEHDTPAKLKQYRQGYLGKDVAADKSVWQLAVGKDAEVRKIADFFGLRYEADQTNKTQFNHSLRTAIIAPDGKVTKIFAGNEWTPSDLLRELQAALK